MGCTTTKKTEQVLEAMSWYFGARQCRSITLQDDTAGDQEDLYFDLNGIDESYSEKQYYVWLDAGTGVDPMVAGKTGVQVVYTSGDSASIISGLVSAAIDSLPEFSSEASGAVAEVENKFLGEISVEDYHADYPGNQSVYFSNYTNSEGFKPNKSDIFFPIAEISIKINEKNIFLPPS